MHLLVFLTGEVVSIAFMAGMAIILWGLVFNGTAALGLEWQTVMDMTWVVVLVVGLMIFLLVGFLPGRALLIALGLATFAYGFHAYETPQMLAGFLLALATFCMGPA